MAFRATTTSLNSALERIERTAAALKNRCLSYKAEIDGVGSNFYAVSGFLADLRNAVGLMDELSLTPGLVDYAKDQRNDPTYEIATEYQSMRAEIIVLGNWIVAALNAQGDLVTYAGDWAETPAAFSTAQVAPMVTRINSVIAVIE